MKSNYLLFLAAGKLFGARLVGAIEILPWRKPRQIPLSYSYVDGLIEYRGLIYPVFNLMQRLGLTQPGPIGFAAQTQEKDESGRSIILLEENKSAFGIVVDAVVKMASMEDPSGALVTAAPIDPQFVKAIIRDDNQDVMILDFERLFYAR
ncbi:MAG TPA: chemotaxis protein CheW [Nitrospirota bacterium]|nr:chemotaxis protein CheW [Nitrospirota bacterium]